MKQNVSHWKGYAICATLLAAIAAIFLAACPAASGGAPRYSCADGTAVAGEASADGIERCSACNAGFRLSNELCNASCTEENGTFTLGDPEGRNTLTLRMITVPVGGGLNFFTDTGDTADATVDSPYSIAETELTYAVWNRVRSWALDSERGTNVYSFNAGRAGSGGSDGGPGDGSADHPVTRISWYDSVKFANALSEYCALTPVYLNGSAVMRTGTTAPTRSGSANGFRLPESNEWELAARYRDGDTNGDGDIKDSGEFYPGDFASGATADLNNAAATQRVAWYSANSMNRAHIVQGKAPNALMLYDMNGNVWEWVFDALSLNRFIRGGSFLTAANFIYISIVSNLPPTHRDRDRGVRLAR